MHSPLAKFEWAQQHAKSLNGDIGRWANSKAEPPVTFRREFKPKRQLVKFRVADVRPPAPSWGLRAGDALNNYRAALDHLAWELFEHGTGRRPPKWREEDVYFPVCSTTRGDFDKMCRRCLPGVTKRMRDLLSPFQPYNTRIRTGRELLWLFDWNRTDKHRNMLPVLLRPFEYTILSRTPSPVTFTALAAGRTPFQAGTHAVTLRLSNWPRDSEPDVSVKFDAARHVFLPGVVPEPIGLIEALESIDKIVGQILGKFIAH